MALFVVATPIGNPKDFTLRSVETIKSADLVLGEEMKVLRQILKSVGVHPPAVDVLNEHSSSRDVAHFVEECRLKRVALVSDCGTPGFADPGADLVAACHAAGIAVHGLPGPSSLMALLMVAGVRVDHFVFAGFLPAKEELRVRAVADLAKEKRPVILLETPYRLKRLIRDLSTVWGDRSCVLGLNLTQDSERVLRGKGREIAQMLAGIEDAEPVLLIERRG